MCSCTTLQLCGVFAVPMKCRLYICVPYDDKRVSCIGRMSVCPGWEVEHRISNLQLSATSVRHCQSCPLSVKAAVCIESFITMVMILVSIILAIISLTLWRLLLPCGYSYKAFCARPDLAVVCYVWHPGTIVRVSGSQKLPMTAQPDLAQDALWLYPYGHSSCHCQTVNCELIEKFTKHFHLFLFAKLDYLLLQDICSVCRNMVLCQNWPEVLIIDIFSTRQSIILVFLWINFCDEILTRSARPWVYTFDGHCCHMGTAIKHPVPDWVKLS